MLLRMCNVDIFSIWCRSLVNETALLEKLKMMSFCLRLVVIACLTVSSMSADSAHSSRKERFLLSVLKFHNARCEGRISSRDAPIEGVCQHRAECRVSRGNAVGRCAIFGTCCAVEKSCNNATSLKVAYFVSPSDSSESFCNFKVDVTNRDICQIRLDFEEFSLAQPTKTEASNEAYSCRKDTFTATSMLTGRNLLPYLCGENAGQHMYVPVNNSQGASSIALSFMIASREANPQLEAPRWRIKISQIECNGMTNDYSSLSASLTTLNNQAWNKEIPSNDHIRRAPTGCLQYFTERTGVYETFNYMNGTGPYIGDLNYAICFRRAPDVCGIRHTPVTFTMASNGADNNYTNSDCDETSNLLIPNQDYLYVPEGFTTEDVIASKYCGEAVNETNFVTSVAPGPLYTFFRSDSIQTGSTQESGFRMNYELLNSGCHDQTF